MTSVDNESEDLSSHINYLERGSSVLPVLYDAMNDPCTSSSVTVDARRLKTVALKYMTYHLHHLMEIVYFWQLLFSYHQWGCSQ